MHEWSTLRGRRERLSLPRPSVCTGRGSSRGAACPTSRYDRPRLGSVAGELKKPHSNLLVTQTYVRGDNHYLAGLGDHHGRCDVDTVTLIECGVLGAIAPLALTTALSPASTQLLTQVGHYVPLVMQSLCPNCSTAITDWAATGLPGVCALPACSTPWQCMRGVALLLP
eukprot:scaffold7232_cov624-Prasinococcus_capsulatus_cf.AAC.3